VQSFKKKYLDELKKLEEKLPPGEMATVSEIVSKPQGRPLVLGKLDGDVQDHIKALLKAGTPTNVSVILAAAECMRTARTRSLL